MKNKNSLIEVVIACIALFLIVVFIILSIHNSTNNLRNNSNTNDYSYNIYENDSNINIYSDIPKEKTIVEEELSSYSTNIYDNDTNRVENIALAISKINNKIIQNEEVFSFNETVGPMDLDHGFKESTVFDSNGNVTKAPGGGMCQISSTMYCGALDANFEIIERHPHSRRVEYVPIDRDATIYYNTLDFKFKNNTGFPIKIIATSDNYNVTIKYNILKEQTSIE